MLRGARRGRVAEVHHDLTRRVAHASRPVHGEALARLHDERLALGELIARRRAAAVAVAVAVAGVVAVPATRHGRTTEYATSDGHDCTDNEPYRQQCADCRL